MKAKRKNLAKRKSKGKPSGCAYRKMRREKLAAAAVAAGISPTPELIPVIGTLETVEDFRREIGEIYRRTRAGMIHNSDASRLTYICSEGAKLARIVDELREITGLRQQLERVNGDSMLPPMRADLQHQSIEG